MRTMDLFCKSHASTAICDSMDQPPSMQLGGRTIDRHNPIIRDGRRATSIARSLPTPCSSSTNLPINPIPYHQLRNQTKTSTHTTNAYKDEHKTEPYTSNQKVADTTTTSTKRNSFSLKSLTYSRGSFSRSSSSSSTEQKRKSGASKLSDNVERIADIIVRKSSAKHNEFNITPQASSRYLLGDCKVLDGLADKNKDNNNDHEISLEGASVKKDDDALQSCFELPSKPFSCQVVVLRVSLHCKGCEGKVRKHLSRMEGVSSFNIDFASKKVTIVGDITPSGALESVSKVKNAQLWPSAPAFGTALNPDTKMVNVVPT